MDSIPINMRYTLTIIVVFLVALGAGIALYMYFFSRPVTVSVAPTSGISLPIAGQGSSSGTSAGATNTPSPTAVSPRLVEISAGPVVPGEVVVDAAPLNASSSPETVVTYIEQQSGNIYSYLAQTQTLTRINNKTLPGIQSASWLPDASTAFVRYLSGSDFSTINTYALAATSSSGFFLPQDLADITVSSTSLLTLASGVSGSVLSIEHTDGTRAATLFTTPLSQIRASFLGKNYLVFTKPAAELPGYAFLGTSSGHLSRLAGPLPGLVALPSPSGQWVLISYVQGSAMKMELVNTTTTATISLPIATIADKCVWTADSASLYCGIPVNPDTSATYPDDWYQGAAHFSDRIWKIDVAGRFAQMTLDFSQAGKGGLDAEALAIDPAQRMLVFVNRDDESLWGYSL